MDVGNKDYRAMDDHYHCKKNGRPIKLYIHPVGQKSTAEDFRNTVIARVPISLVETSVVSYEPSKIELVTRLV
jgi:hypothetical protein